MQIRFASLFGPLLLGAVLVSAGTVVTLVFHKPAMAQSAAADVTATYAKYYEKSLSGQHPNIPKTWRLIAVTKDDDFDRVHWVQMWFQDSATGNVYQRHGGVDTVGDLVMGGTGVNMLEAK